LLAKKPTSTLAHATGMAQPCAKDKLQYSKQATTRNKLPDPVTPASKIVAKNTAHLKIAGNLYL
jgi:hypothetical protein